MRALTSKGRRPERPASDVFRLPSQPRNLCPRDQPKSEPDPCRDENEIIEEPEGRNEVRDQIDGRQGIGRRQECDQPSGQGRFGITSRQPQDDDVPLQPLRRSLQPIGDDREALPQDHETTIFRPGYGNLRLPS